MKYCPVSDWEALINFGIYVEFCVPFIVDKATYLLLIWRSPCCTVCFWNVYTKIYLTSQYFKIISFYHKNSIMGGNPQHKALHDNYLNEMHCTYLPVRQINRPADLCSFIKQMRMPLRGLHKNLNTLFFCTRCSKVVLFLNNQQFNNLHQNYYLILLVLYNWMSSWS